MNLWMHLCFLLILSLFNNWSEDLDWRFLNVFRALKKGVEFVLKLLIYVDWVGVEGGSILWDASCFIQSSLHISFDYKVYQKMINKLATRSSFA